MYSLIHRRLPGFCRRRGWDGGRSLPDRGWGCRHRLVAGGRVRPRLSRRWGEPDGGRNGHGEPWPQRDPRSPPGRRRIFRSGRVRPPQPWRRGRQSRPQRRPPGMGLRRPPGRRHRPPRRIWPEGHRHRGDLLHRYDDQARIEQLLPRERGMDRLPLGPPAHHHQSRLSHFRPTGLRSFFGSDRLL